MNLSSEQRKDYIQKGICPHCQKRPLAPGFRHCEKCLKQKRETGRRNSRKNRESYLSQGVCPSCRTNPLASGKTRCQECLEKEASRGKVKRAKARAQNICQRCLQSPVAPGKTQCQDCLESSKDENRQWRKDNANGSLCLRCRGPLDEPGYASCSICRRQQVEYNSRKYQDRIAQGLCTMCGNLRDENEFSTRLCTDCWQKDFSRRLKVHSKARYDGQLEAIIERDKKCVICNRPYGVRTNKVVCHHIDGDVSNNSHDNLILLCRKCHVATERWIELSEPHREKLLQFLLHHYPIT